MMAVAVSEPPANQDAPVALPPMKVVGAKPERFTVACMVGREDSFRLVIWPMPAKKDFLCVMIGGVRQGDEIVSISGKPVSEMKRNTWQRELYDDFTLVMRRAKGRRGWEYFETEGRRGFP
jgi:hypothetical protein